ATVDAYGAVGSEIAVRIVVPGAKFDLAGFTSRQTAPLWVHDRHPLVGKRPANRAEAPIAARIDGDPGRLAATIALRHRDAEALLEALPLLFGERRRTRRDEAQHRHVGGAHRVAGAEQHVDGGRIAGRDCYAVRAYMVEETRC